MDKVRNVALITVDCLRADHLPAFGYDRDTAPFLTSLADRSVQFDNAFATGPGTSVSFPSIFTGTYPFEFGGYGKLSAERMPIASVVDEAGVETLGVHSNTYLSRAFGYERGFNTYESFYDRPGGLVRLENKVRSVLDEDGLPFRLLKQVYESVIGGADNGISLPYEQADSLTDTVVDRLTDVSPPFFLWTHYMDAHAPHHPPDRYFEAFGGEPPDWETHHNSWLAAKEDPTTATDGTVDQFINAYDAEIRFVDEQISRLVKEMKRLGVHDNTLYIVTADHGELLGEHDTFSHPPQLHDELLHVPLFIHLSDVTEGRHSEDLVSLIDLPTTIAEALDIESPDSYRGQSLLPAIEGQDCGHDYVFAEVCHRPGEGMSAGAYDPDKVMVYCRSPTAVYIRDKQRETEAFRRVGSTGGGADSDVSHSEREALRGAVDDHIRAIKTGDGSFETTEIDAETAERLRDLGYAE